MRELLVIADRDGGKQSAFYHALEIAKNTGASIEFVGFVHAPGVDSCEILTHENKRQVRHRYIDKKQKELDDFLAKVDLSDISVKSDAVWEKSFEKWVIARCDQKSFDMVFKSGKRKSSKSFSFTPGDWQLLKSCPEPVMLVGENPWKQGGIALAALDLGSTGQKTLELNEDILRQADKFCKAANAELHVCYSMAIPKVLAEIIDVSTYEKNMQENLDPVVSRLIEQAGIDPAHIHLVTGKPAREICRICDEIDADLLFIGNKTRTSLRGRLMGNTAENVLDCVSADVVVVK